MTKFKRNRNQSVGEVLAARRTVAEAPTLADAPCRSHTATADAEYDTRSCQNGYKVATVVENEQ